MKIIVSLTTIPKRMSTLYLVLQSILDQTYPISEIHLNIPYFCLRTGEHYEIPPEIREYPKVKVFRTEDFGAATKIAPTFRRIGRDGASYIWQVDDDICYPQNALELLVQGMAMMSESGIVCRYGGILNNGSNLQNLYGFGTVDFMEGYGGILYPPDCITPSFFQVLDEVKEIEFIRNADDVYLSMYFKFVGVAMFMYNPLSEQNPYGINSITSSAVDALSYSGHLDNYGKAYDYLTKVFERNSPTFYSP
jgi:hypothetical protein